MGAACCIAAKDKDVVPSRSLVDISHRNVRCSPTWSFRWDNRRRVVAGEIEDASYPRSCGLSSDVSVEIKGPLGSERANISDEGSRQESFGTPVFLKSPAHGGRGGSSKIESADISMESNYPLEEKNMGESPDIADLSAPKLSFSLHSPFSAPTAASLPANAHSTPPNSTPSRRARRSPGHLLLRHISDSQIPGLKSPNDYSLSRGGSSDGWSMRTFSELVASSQRERWSFDSEHLGSGFGKVSGCSSRFSYSPSLDMRTCGACSKYLTERASWSSNEVAIVAVLVCGHVYHAECLENMTLEVDRYDPPCPICVGGEKQVSKISKKALRAEAMMKLKSTKILKNRVVDGYNDNSSDEFYHKKKALGDGEASNMEPNFHAASSSTKPFLKRHFSFSSKWNRSPPENDSTRKKGFWTRYRKT